MLNFKPNSLSWIELVINKLNRNKVLNLTNISTVLFGSIILIISAKIKVDLYPVPMTLQPLAVLMIGMLYGRNLATATIGLYILQGIAGLPVFAYGGGLLYLFGPTGGFYVGGVPTKPMKPQRLKKGGLAKPKVKPKRMKKGGLASRKK